MFPAAMLLLGAPDARLLFLVNLATVVAVVAFATGVVYLLLRRSYQRRVEEQKLAAMGTATARILHQIKNPLQTILLHADLLQDRAVASREESRREICQAIVGEAQRLSAMLSELSVYAAGSRRRMSLEPLPLHQLLGQLAANAQRDGRLQVDASRLAEATVLADVYYLRQALDNLLSNAADAMEGRTPARLTLSLERQEEWVAVGVEDTGPGIPPERMESIFQPFVSTKSKGMGLGLAICREVVEGHGGRLEVRSEMGVGTRFTLLLPAEAVTPPSLEERAPARAALTHHA